jgi:hypothetical protein
MAFSNINQRSSDMNKPTKTLKIIFLAFLIPGLHGCSTLPSKSSLPDPVVGAWLVKDPNAPFPYHMYVFNSDRTMQQANPDAGDSHASDSDGKGIWVPDGDQIKGKWVEVIADRATHRFSGRLEISYQIRVAGDTFIGTETVRSYDADGNIGEGPPTPGQIEGKRITFP